MRRLGWAVLALCSTLTAWRFARVGYAPPDLIVGQQNNAYMLRWHIFRVGMLPRVYVHKFMRSDDDRALHDHPWAYLSILLRGSYVEVTDKGRKARTPGSFAWRGINHRHRVELYDDGNFYLPCWTLFITGRERRNWGFWCNGETFYDRKEFNGCELSPKPLESGSAAR